MKNLKFSRLFAAMMFVACLAFVGCKPQTEEVTVEKVIVVRPLEADDGIIGTWISTYDEKYDISITDYDNYSHYDADYNYDADNWHLYYSTNKLKIYEIDETSGFLYGQFDDENHIGYGATKGQWYALMYTGLTDTYVKLWQPYKDGGKAACDTLEEAVKEFTVDNGYFAGFSECTK